MEILVKETATLHKVLSRYLAPIVVEVRFLLSVRAVLPTATSHYLPFDWPTYFRNLCMFMI
jgi:hypothetical protein